MLEKLNLKPGLLKQFLIVCIGSEAIYYMYAIRNVLFNPYRDMLGLTNTQLGLVLSVMGMVAFFGGIPSAWVLNRFSARRLMSLNLVITGATGFYMISRFVSYPGMLVVGVIWGFSMEAFYWGAVTKSIRCLAPDDKQGIAFGTMEFTRGLVNMGLNIGAVAIFAIFSESLLGIRVTMGIVGGFLILMGILTWILLPEEDFLKSETGAGKSKESLQGVIKCLKTPQLWLAGFMGMGVYAVYMGCSFFLPFLQDVLMVPVLIVAAFGIASSNWVRMISGPVSGFMANKLFKSSTALMRILFFIGIIFLAVIIMVPKTPDFVWPLTILLIILQVVVYMLRGVYYAPIGESGIPKSISGSAMAVAILMIQSPMLWAFALYGYLIDKYPGAQGFMIIFTIMISLYGVGFIASNILLWIIKKQGLKIDTGEEVSHDSQA
jgi:MFS family permease